MLRLSDYELHGHVHEIMTWCKAAHAKRRIIDLLNKAFRVPDGTEPDREACQRALRAFYDQPEREIKRIMNGWRPQPVRASAELARLQETLDVARVVSLYYRPEHNEMEAYGEFRRGLCMEPMTIMITEGTSQDAAIDALTRALYMVTNQWRELTGMEADTADEGQLCYLDCPGAADFVSDEEKQRPSESTPTHKPESKERMELMEPTAA